MRLEELLRCATEIADALAHAHREHQVHRDLKPGNIILTRSGAKVLDFGLARAVHNPDSEDTHTLTAAATAAGTVMGTFPYMSPEQLHGAKVDTR
jgi:serine/threonine protein kinase